MTAYPESPAARDRWILDRRPPRNALDPLRPYAFFAEREAGTSGESVDVATILLTNRECPWRCLMCDLWRNTLPETVPAGAIPGQIRHAIQQLPDLRPASSHLKLYNAGSFFDPHAIPPSDLAEVARLSSPFLRTIVECHPALVGDRCTAFRDQLARPLEVAMGLETTHPVVLERLNKRMTLEQFRGAARFLKAHGIDLRVFILLRPPWLSEGEGVVWAKRSLDFAFDCGATVCSVIPTRAGNGALDVLSRVGDFEPPSLRSLEAVVEYGLSRSAAKIFADLWDAETLANCSACSRARINRLREMNATQIFIEPVECKLC